MASSSSRIHVAILLLHLFIRIQSSSVSRTVLSEPLTMMPCNLSDSPQNLFNGKTVFKNFQSLTTSQASIGGWVFPRGFNEGTFYTIFSIHESFDSQIYAISYSPSTYTIRETISLVDNFKNVPQFTTTEWFYVASIIQSNPLNGMLNSNSVIYRTDSTLIFTSSLYYQSLQNDFKIADLIFNIGFSSSILTSNILPSCALTKYVCSFTSNALGEINQFLFDISALGSYLLHHFDDYYTPLNLSKLFSTNGLYENALHIPTSSTDPFLLSTTTSPQFSTDYINASKNGGFTIQFYIRINSPQFSSIRVLTIIENIGFVDFLSNQGNNEINLGGIVSIQQVNFSNWLEIIVIIKFGLSNVMQISERSYHTDKVKIAIPQSNQRTLRVRFGSRSNTDTFRVRNIRIYSGVFITSDIANNCFFGMINNKTMTPECLICDPGYLINLSLINPSCEPVSSTNQEQTCPFIREWTPVRVACPHPSMIHDRSGNSICRCRKQQYFNGTKCVICPHYCLDCLSPTGKCVNTGIIKSKSQLIPGKLQSLQQFWFPPGQFDNTFTDSFLQLEGQNSFLISFSFTPILSDITYSSPIALVMLGSLEYIAVVLDQQTRGSLTVNLYINGVQVVTHSIHPYLTTWYSLYSNLVNTVLYYNTNGHLSHMKWVSQLQVMSAVAICIGVCSNNSKIPQKITGNPHAKPVRYILNSPNPLDYSEEELQNLLCDEPIEIAFFSLDLRLYPDRYLGEYASSTVVGQKIDFGKTPVNLTEQLKGFGFYNSETIGTVDVGLIDIPFSFSTDIFITKIGTQITLLSQDLDPNSQFIIEYYLVPQEVDNSVTIRICVEYECQDTINPLTKLYMYERNFLAILTQDRSQFNLEFMKISFKIYCNFASETLIFFKERPSHRFTRLTNTIVKIGLQSERVEEYLFFLNRIQFVSGNTYHYENLIDGNPCYLSLDSPSKLSTQCILPNDGFLLHLGPISPVVESDCIILKNTYINFINIYTRECISSSQLRSQCVELDQITLTCKQCQDGYYLLFHGDLLSPQASCEPCSAYCGTCIGGSNNCLTCINSSSEVIPPYCLCDQPGFYLNSSSSKCEKCHDRCETCFGTATNCLTCSNSRIPPPFCACDAAISYEFTPPGSSIAQCILYTCNIQCQSCINTPFECLACSQNRENPPICSCITGTFPNSNGICSTCPKQSFFDSTLKQCVPCYGLCEECQDTQQKCRTCIAGLTMFDGMCFCAGNQQAILSSFNQQVICANEMDVQFSLEISGRNQYVFVFTFSQELLPTIDFTSTPISSLLYVYIDEVPTNMYTLSNPVISFNELRVDFTGLTNFRASSGSITFQVNHVFVNSQEDHILSRKYLKDQLSFNSIGPFVFAEETDSWSSLFDIGNNIQQGHELLLATIQGFQLVSYFLNTIQSSVMFLLLPISFPPNLYGFLSKLGLVIYPDVQKYQGTPNAQGYQFYDFEGDQSESNTDRIPIQTARSLKRNLKQNYEKANSSRISNEFAFRRLGFSNSALISMPLICLKYVVLLLLLFLNELMLQKAQKSETWVKAKSFLIGQLLTEGEVNLLIVSIAILNQLSNIDQFDWTNRYGFYLSCLIILVNLFCITKLIRELFIFSRSLIRNQIESSRVGISSTLIEKKDKLESKESATQSSINQVDLKYGELSYSAYTRNNVYWERLTSRIKKKRIKLSHSYFLLQMMKKLVIIGVIFFMRNFPKAVCVVCSMIYFVSSLSTISMKPYLNKRSRYCQIITDIMFSVIWILHYWIVEIDAQMTDSSNDKSAQSELDSRDVEIYFFLGNVVIILVMVVNILNIIEQVCCLIDQIKEYLKNRKKIKEKNVLMSNDHFLELKTPPIERKLVIANYPQQKKVLFNTTSITEGGLEKKREKSLQTTNQL